MSRSVFLILTAIFGLATSLFSHVQAVQGDAHLVRHTLYAYTKLLSPEAAFEECHGTAACQNLPLDPELVSWNGDLGSLTENQLRGLCRGAKAQATCLSQQANCVPKDFQPLVEPINHGLIKLFEVCDQPTLYTDYQAIKTCAQSVAGIFSSLERYSFLSSYTMFTVCPYSAFIAAKSAVKELERIDAVANRWSFQTYRFTFDRDTTTTTTTTASPVPVAVNVTEIQHGVCCGAKAIVECGLTTLIRDTCSSEATAVVDRHLEHFLNSFNCIQATASRPCPMFIKLAK